MRSRKALAASALIIVVTTSPNGIAGNGTPSSTSAICLRTLIDSSKFLRTAGCAFSNEPLMTPILNFLPWRFTGSSYLNGFAIVVGSFGSCPAMAANTNPQSSAVLHIGPSLSSVQHRAIAPWRLTRPYVGRRPETPQYAAGVMIEPDVSEPMANGIKPAAV